MSETNKQATQETVGEESLAGINEDGGVTKLVIAPMIVVVLVVIVIVVMRTMQKKRESAEMEASLKE